MIDWPKLFECTDQPDAANPFEDGSVAHLLWKYVAEERYTIPEHVSTLR